MNEKYFNKNMFLLIIVFLLLLLSIILWTIVSLIFNWFTPTNKLLYLFYILHIFVYILIPFGLFIFIKNLNKAFLRVIIVSNILILKTSFPMIFRVIEINYNDVEEIIFLKDPFDIKDNNVRFNEIEIILKNTKRSKIGLVDNHLVKFIDENFHKVVIK